MGTILINKKDEIVMKLVHYFITEKNYTPIVVGGVKDEIWLESNDGPYRIIRINSKYIHNNEQFDFDVFKTENIMNQIKKKTFSFSVNTLNILLDTNENVKIKDIKNISTIKVDSINDLNNDKELISNFPDIKKKLKSKINDIDFIIKVTNEINEKTEKENKKYEKTFSPKKIIITPALIAINIMIFLAMYIFGNGSTDINTLIAFGANFGPLVKNGEVFRLITAAFLHIGLIHLAVNMYSLHLIGTQIENYFGKTKYLTIYLGSAIVGSLLSVVLTDAVSAGASGAIFGLLGSLLYFGYHYRLYLGTVLKDRIIPIIIFNLVLGFMVSGIDNAAHIGGLIGGVLLSMAVGVEGKTTKSERINGWITLILLLGFLLYLVFI